MTQLIIFAVLVAIATRTVVALNLGSCTFPLGLESGLIKDSAITASSSYDASNVGPQFARLHQDKNGGAWCPKQQVMRGIREWIEIDLKTMHVITTVQTQGRFGNGQGQEYVEKFKLEYWRPGMERWTRYRDHTGVEILSGNTNTYMVTKNNLDPVILASKLRLVPHSLHRRTVCLRMELSGCQFKEGVTSYSAPQGDVFLNSNMIDETYDGIIENGFMKGGLGQLIDGRTGHDNVENDLTGFGKGYEWVGWQNKTNASRLGPLELTFEFEGIRNFSRIDVFLNNDYYKHIQVFSELKILFSIGGHKFSSDEAVTYFYMPDLSLDKARNVSIRLGFKLARYLKLQFTFAAEWLVISEIYFHSEPVEGNFSDEARIRGRQIDESYLQRDAVAQIKTSTVDDDLTTTVKNDSSHTGIIIGVMTSIIIVLVGAIVGMSIRNFRQAVRRSIIPKSFGKLNPQGLGPDIKHNALDLRYKTTLDDYNYDTVAAGNIVESNIVNQIVERSRSSDSSTVYNEPFSEDAYSFCVPPKLKHAVSNEDMAIGGHEYNVSIYSCQTDQPSPTVLTSSAQYFVRLYSHINYASIEEQHSLGAPTLLIRTSPRCNTHDETPTLSSIDENGFYATTDLFQQSELDSSRMETPADDGGENLDQLPEIIHEKLNRVNRLARGQFGDEVYLGQLVTNEAKIASVLCRRLPPFWTRNDVVKECRAQRKLEHEKLLQFLGVVMPEPSENNYSVIFGFGQFIDMCQFLQEHVAETSSLSERSLSYGCLIYMAKQVAAAMEYLEAHQIIHRDLATRNCLVEPNYGVKIASFGISSEMYPTDYFTMDDGRYIPLRWMAWESVTLDKFSSSSDIWSFAVLLWEILTFARDPPMEALNDDEVLHLLVHYQQEEDGYDEMLLGNPILCPKEIYDLMCECWQRNEVDRPTFKEIHMFLMRKNLGYDPKIK